MGGHPRGLVATASTAACTSSLGTSKRRAQ